MSSAQDHPVPAARPGLTAVAAQPLELNVWLPRGMALMAAALGGLGLILWVAANWNDLGRVGRFALLQGLVVASLVGALARPAARVPLGLLALLGVGGLLAYFGQTYQTGADPWQLFALWAALSLPLCLATRSDALWAPWAVVVSTAISLWLHARAGHRWSVDRGDMWVHMLAWAASGALVLGLGPALARLTGAGQWARRVALTLALCFVSFGAVGSLFHLTVSPLYLMGLIALSLSGVALYQRPWFDLYGLSAVALAWNGLVVAGLCRLLFDTESFRDPIGELFIIGLVAAVLLAASVSTILRRARALREEGLA